MEIVFFWFMFSVAIAILANRYNRNAIVWFLISFALSPLLAVVFLLALGSVQASADGQRAVPGT